MKNNHTRIQQLIQQAIQACQDDFALEDTISSLRRAMTSVSKVAAKRTKRNSAYEKFQEEAKLNHKRWWDRVVENAKKSAEMNLNNDV